MPRRSQVMARLLGVGVLDPALNDFADSAVGRSISETVMKEGISQEVSDMAKAMFEKFKAEGEQVSLATEGRTQEAPDEMLDDLVDEGEMQ